MFWTRKYKTQEGEGYTSVRTGEGKKQRNSSKNHWKKYLGKHSKSGINLQLSYLQEHFTPSTINFLVSSHWL